MKDLTYPIGQYEGPGDFDSESTQKMISRINDLPPRLRELVNNMSIIQLNTPYRPDGWTVRQVVHHMADSHLNAYARCKRILTEDNPTILPYNQNAWADLSDSVGSIKSSLLMLDAIHRRWVTLLSSLNDVDFARTYTHPEHSGPQKLFYMIGLYAWHGDHHYNHIEQLATREGWLSTT